MIIFLYHRCTFGKAWVWTSIKKLRVLEYFLDWLNWKYHVKTVAIKFSAFLWEIKVQHNNWQYKSLDAWLYYMHVHLCSLYSVDVQRWLISFWRLMLFVTNCGATVPLKLFFRLFLIWRQFPQDPKHPCSCKSWEQLVMKLTAHPQTEEHFYGPSITHLELRRCGSDAFSTSLLSVFFG